MSKDLFLIVKKQKLNTKKKTVLNKFRNKEHLIRLFLSLALMAVVVLSFISLLGIECYIWPSLGIGVFFTLLIWLEWGRKTSVYAVVAFVFGFILIGFVMKNNFALNSVLMVYNAFAEKIGALGIRNPQLYIINVAETAYPLYLTYFMAMFAAFAGLVAYMTVAHRQHFYLYLYSALILILCLLGFEIGLLYACAYILIVLLILLYNRSQQLRLSYVHVSVAVVTVALVSLLISYIVSPVLKANRSPYEAISDAVHYSEGNADGYGNGKLSGQKFDKKHENALKVTMSEPKPMYLKGFVGANFNGSSWSEPEYDISYVESELFYLLHKNGFMNYSQCASLNLIINPETKISNVEIEYINADNRYLYLPYETSSFISGNVLKTNGDYYKRNSFDENKYSFMVTSTLYQKLLSLSTENKDKLSGLSYEKYSLCEENYYEYAQKYYMDVDEQDRKAIEKAFSEEKIEIYNSEIKNYEKIVEQVRTLINSRITYDESIRISVFENNVVDWLLNKRKAGYDKHYATLATLMFRVMGIPSRYVEGYIIPINDAVKMKSNVAYNVKGTNAHAWTEIYVEGTGWVPVEINEDDYNKMFPDIENHGILEN